MKTIHRRSLYFFTNALWVEYMQTHDLPTYQQTRRDLRNNPTLAERQLWQELKGKQLEGFKFRRQHGIGRYIVDFFCPKLRLIIEIDGSIHQTEHAVAYDSLREKELEQAGFLILRYSNEDVFQRMDTVIGSIRQTCVRLHSSVPSR